MAFFYYLGLLIAKSLLLVLARYRVKGRGKVPTDGPLIVAANHLHRLGPPVLGVAITGTEKIKGVAWPFRRPEITINIGRPFYLSPDGGESTKEKLSRHTELIMSNIAGLLPDSYQGVYKNKREAT